MARMASTTTILKSSAISDMKDVICKENARTSMAACSVKRAHLSAACHACILRACYETEHGEQTRETAEAVSACEAHAPHVVYATPDTRVATATRYRDSTKRSRCSIA
eukprot:6176341-Pleurochrysis_carterae.AAC.2